MHFLKDKCLTVYKFLDTIDITKEYLKNNNNDGKSFNIFKIINAVNDETTVHSAFIAELLNPKGSHGQGDLFLKIFLSKINIKEEFCTKNAFVKTEYHIGFRSSEEPIGGRIDILIRDKNDSIIAIENKIYATDQEWQLLRYYNNFSDKEKLHLLYLTLDGNNPTPNSITCQKEKKSDNLAYYIRREQDHFRTISYKKEILDWLNSCVKSLKTNNKSYLSHAIQQYIELVKTLTDKSTNLKMRKEMVDKVIQTPEDLKAILEVSNLLPIVKTKIQWQFWETLMSKFEKHVKRLDNKLSEKDVYYYYIKGERLLQINTEIVNQKSYSIYWRAEIDRNFYIGFFGIDNHNIKQPISLLNENLDKFLKSAGYKDSDNSNNGVYRYIYEDKYMSRNELNFYSFESETIINLIDEEQRNTLINSIIEIAEKEIKGVVAFLRKHNEC